MHFPTELREKFKSNFIEKKTKTKALNFTCFTLEVSDNGVGIPRTLKLKILNSLGFKQVATLVDQLGGKFDLKRYNGTKFTMRFKVIKKDKH